MVSNRGPLEVPESRNGLNAFLEEIATQFGIPDYFDRDKGDFPARIHGYIGGNSVRAFSHFAQNFLRALSPEQGAMLLTQYGLAIPDEEKRKVTEYLTQINYTPRTDEERRQHRMNEGRPNSINSSILAQLSGMDNGNGNTAPPMQ